MGMCADHTFCIRAIKHWNCGKMGKIMVKRRETGEAGSVYATTNLRSKSPGGQKDSIYQATNHFKIAGAFRKSKFESSKKELWRTSLTSGMAMLPRRF